MQPCFESGGDKRVEFRRFDIRFSNPQQLRFFRRERVVILAAGARIADQFVLFVQPDFEFDIEGRRSHGERPAVAPVTDEIRLMNRPAPRPFRSETGIEQVLNLWCLMMRNRQLTYLFDQPVLIEISCHNFPWSGPSDLSSATSDL